VVFVHGVPTHSEDWMPLLEQMQGPAIALDRPGFGRSERPEPGSFDHSMYGYGHFVERFLEQMGIGEHALAVHDWGVVGLFSAQRRPDRIRRLLLMNSVPFFAGYRWHRTARIWRTPVLGELSNRLWTRRLLDLGLRESRGDWSRHDPAFVDMVWDHVDPATFSAILSLYRSAPPSALAVAGERLGEITAPALIVWSLRDRYLPARFGRGWAERFPNGELMELPEAGHWPWRDEPAIIPRLVEFLEGEV
jgi:pimeloyl-ACP methyl ester carboxylesterase